ncbi:zinc ribbon domain-containing protein [Spectribacter hydrogenoxidans]|uniref:Zinc ribbon domain-containing protein n=1 Tax=Spectribacter hydrogenoxidans TaxID=3075608 RepID=A0ABU3C0N7_9GAMM|nr:zinc ribbon domain-containing protein [Salinisphaera sp. W335]MDT0635111.1 zinc ribbon domain-containing protein [Salinisphaera sp. W335]
MPIYEYVCESCGAEIERLQRMAEDALKDCPDCEKPSLKRKISAAGFRLAGSGWYETDFKKDGKRNLAGAENKADSGKSDSSKADGGGDSKSSSTSKSESSGKSDKKDKTSASTGTG